MEDYIRIFKGGTYTTASSASENETGRLLPSVRLCPPSKRVREEDRGGSPPKINKVIVFDIDETIGSFYELMLLWNGLEEFGIYLNQEFFNDLLDMYPEFLRYGIITIFEYLLHKKRTRDCHKVFIYTNNIYSPEFPMRIKKYFDYKLKTTDFFDQIICAFKVNGKIIEPSRTTNHKTYDDFMKCTVLPPNTETCFIDNTYYEKMNHEKVYYIQSKPYNHGLSSSEIMQRFFHSQLYDQIVGAIANIKDPKGNYGNIENDVKTHFTRAMKKGRTKPKVDMEIDLMVTQKMMSCIEDFFNHVSPSPPLSIKSNNDERKGKGPSNNKTKRNWYPLCKWRRSTAKTY